MSLQRQISFWLGAFILFVLALFLFREFLLPFVAGLAIAYALDPLADRLERMGLSRLVATVVILLLFIFAFLLFILLLAPILVQQIGEFAVRLPGYLEALQGFVTKLANGPLMDYLGVKDGNLPKPLQDIVANIANWVGKLAGSVWSGGMAVISFMALFVVTPVVAFYMLLDWDRMVAQVDSWLPRDHVDTIRQLATEIDRAIAGFVRGQGTVCLLLGLFYAIGLSLVGLNFGLLIGLGAGLISFVPYVGSTVGLLVAGGVALVQFWPDWVMITIVVAIFVTGQFLEGNILSPKLVGRSVGLHPVWLMFALFAFGYLFGFVGMLLAVPLAAAIGVLSRFALRQYLASQIYYGATRGKADRGEAGDRP